MSTAQHIPTLARLTELKQDLATQHSTMVTRLAELEHDGAGLRSARSAPAPLRPPLTPPLHMAGYCHISGWREGNLIAGP